jgi:hypothetical protein
VIVAQATAVQPVPPAANRPAERSSRLSNGVIPLAVIFVVILAANMRRMRRKREQALRDEPPAPPV